MRTFIYTIGLHYVYCCDVQTVAHRATRDALVKRKENKTTGSQCNLHSAGESVSHLLVIITIMAVVVKLTLNSVARAAINYLIF